MGNLEIWDALKQPPPEALKLIQGGRIKGKTDINPQWRYKAMTEQFGVCGFGWKYTVEKLWLEPVGDEICAFAQVSLFIMEEHWSEAIPGIGGSMLVAKESKWPYVSDECYKMAITDALSVAMKMIGVAADIYAGLFDGSKYSRETSKSTTTPPPTSEKREKEPTEGMITDKQIERLKKAGTKYQGIENMKVYTELLKKSYKTTSFNKLNALQAEELITRLEKGEGLKIEDKKSEPTEPEDILF